MSAKGIKGPIFVVDSMVKYETCGVKCQICALNTHLADECPFSYTRCTVPGCNGIRVFGIFETEKYRHRKYLKCHSADCIGFQWLDQAIIQKLGGASSSSISKQEGCFQWGELDHWKGYCPWSSTKCNIRGCPETRSCYTSGVRRSKGRKYLKCTRCNSFEWLDQAVTRAKKGKAMGSKRISEVTLDELCERMKQLGH